MKTAAESSEAFQTLRADAAADYRSAARFGRLALSLLSAALLICSLPSPDIGWLAWIALVPLIIACDGVAPMRAAGIGFVHGYVAAFGIYNWLFQLPAFGWRHAFVLAAYVALYPTLFCFALGFFNRRRAPFLFTVPALWTAVEYLRANAGFLALPWGTLAHAQHENLAILQIASVAGEHGVTFLVALGNAAIAQLILGRLSRRDAETPSSENLSVSICSLSPASAPLRLCERYSEFFPVLTAVFIIALAHVWGISVLYTEQPGPTLRVAAIQPNIQIAERESKQGAADGFKRLEQLTRSAAAAKPDLIVWPESAVAGNLQSDRAMLGAIKALTDSVNVPIVVGAAEVQKFSSGERETTVRSRIFNSAFLMQPGLGLSEPYRKRVLLPFGEYLPYERLISWPQWLAPKVSEMTPGAGAQIWQMANGVKIGALICWENLFAPLARDSVNAGAHILVQLTNDVWFGNTAAPHQHNLMSIMRAVENRVPVVIASNTGPSMIIDSYGRSVENVRNSFTEGIAVGGVDWNDGKTTYSRFGDVLLFAMIGVISFFIAMRRSHRAKEEA